MSEYKITLTPDLEEVCQDVANHLDISIEAVLSSAIQLYMEHLRLETYESVRHVERVRCYSERHKRF